MLDFVKELIPLLEGAKDGAIWLVSAYFGLMLIETLLWAAGLMYLVKKVFQVVTSAQSKDLMTVSAFESDGTVVSYKVTPRVLKSLLSACASRGQRVVSCHDIEVAIRKLKSSE